MDKSCSTAEKPERLIALGLQDEHTALFKFSVGAGHFAGRLVFVHGYHDDAVNFYCHVFSMPIYFHSLVALPSMWIVPLPPSWIQALATLLALSFYPRQDSWAGLLYTICVYLVYEVSICLGIPYSAWFSFVAMIYGIVQIVVLQVLIGHCTFQGYNASFEVNEGLFYTPFYFTLRALQVFLGYNGHHEETCTVPPPANIRIGEMGEQNNREWRNWAGNSCAQVDRMFFPSTAQDLIQIVKEAKIHQKKIRIVGKGHTFNSLTACDDGDYLVRTDWLKSISVDADTQTVTTEPGVTVDELDQALLRHDLCMPTNVILKSVTIGGIMQTGSHGCGYAPMNEAILSMAIVDGNGELRHLRKEDDGDEFLAAVQGLGMCGLVASMTFSVQRMRTLRVSTVRTESWMHSSEIRQLYHSSDQFQCFWFPGCGHFVRRWDRVDQAPTWVDSAKYEVGSFIAHLMSPVAMRRSKIGADWVSRTATAAALTAPWQQRVAKAPEAIHYIHRLQDVPIHSTEFAMRVQDLDAAFSIVAELQAEFEERGEDSLLFCCECRVTPPGAALLCAGARCEEEGLVAWFEIVGRRAWSGDRRFERFAALFAQRVMARIEAALPHWAKNLDVLPDLAPMLRQRFGSNMQRFESVRRKMDPSGVLMNDKCRQLFHAPPREASPQLSLQSE